MLTPFVIAAVVGYLLGSLPFGYLIARRFGINIFEHGSKNPGATNVKRVLGEKFGQKGKRAGDLAFFLDALKGAAAVAVWILPLRCQGWDCEGLTWFTRIPDPQTNLPLLAITGLVFALVGHSFPCWTHFKGGKGVATSAGGLLVLLPLAAVIGLVAWVLTFTISRYVSLASIVAAVVLPASAWLIPGTPRPFAIVATVIGLFVIIRHRTNIQRLLNGTENRFVKKSADTPTPSA